MVPVYEAAALFDANLTGYNCYCCYYCKSRLEQMPHQRMKWMNLIGFLNFKRYVIVNRIEFKVRIKILLKLSHC